MKNIVFFAILVLSIYNSESYRILGIFNPPVQSHYFLGSALMRGLAEKGHDVTVISPFGEKDIPKHWKYRDIVLTGFVEEHEKKQINFMDDKKSAIFKFFLIPMIISKIAQKSTEDTLSHPNVQKLLNSKEEKFDVIIVEQFLNDALKGFAHHYKAPLVLFFTTRTNMFINPLIGNPANPSYVPDTLLNFPSHMSFPQRVMNSVASAAAELYKHLFLYPSQNKILHKHFPDADLSILNYNVSLVLQNSHISSSPSVPKVPNLIDIGGFHVKPPKELPKDLKTYMDSSKNGVIYFSLGSNMKSKDLPEETKNVLLKTFSTLKQNVLWKFEEDLPDLPANVKISKWLPQQDILAHPNTKLFITHGGYLSIIETIYHGVPILAFPLFADQKSNAAEAESSGYGLVLNIRELTEAELSKSLSMLLEDPRYNENAKIRSKIMHDNENTPMDTANFWVEYVVRHKGALHLRSSALNLAWYQYLLLDVIFVLFLASTIVIMLLFIIVKTIVNVRRKSKTKVKTN